MADYSNDGQYQNGSTSALSKAVRRKLHACVVHESSAVHCSKTHQSIQLCRLCKPPKSSSQKVCSKGLPVYLHGRRYVPPPCRLRSLLTAPPVISCKFVLYLGESGLGKSTLINTLFNTTLYAPKEILAPSAERPKTVAIQSISAGQYTLLIHFLSHFLGFNLVAVSSPLAVSR